MAYDQNIVTLLIEDAPGFVCNWKHFEHMAGIQSQG